MKLYKHLTMLLTFMAFTAFSFSATLIIQGKVHNTNGSVPIEYSLDGFTTTTTIYSKVSGSSTGTFTDTIVVTKTSVAITFRVLTCDSLYYEDSLLWTSGSRTNYLYPELDYCPRLFPKCFASFSFSVQDSIVSFVNTSKGANPVYRWSFGDSSFSSSVSPKHTYAKDTTYTVCLFMYDSVTSCSDSICVSVTTGSNNVPGCKAKFRVVKDSNYKYGIVILNQSTGGSGLGYLWDFGDGNTSSSKNPSHAYKSFGKYNLCLTVYLSGTTCRSMYCDSIGLDSSGKMLKAGFSITVIDEVLSAKDQLSNTIKLYPNPVSDLLKLDIPENVRVRHISISDLRGQKVLEIANESAFNVINVSDLSKGTYFLHVATDFGLINRKFNKM